MNPSKQLFNEYLVGVAVVATIALTYFLWLAVIRPFLFHPRLHKPFKPSRPFVPSERDECESFVPIAPRSIVIPEGARRFVQGATFPVSLTFDELRVKNVLRCVEVFHPIPALTTMEWSAAVAGEAGEVCNACKKLKRVDMWWRTKPGDPKTREEAIADIRKECADVVTYLDLLSTSLGFKLEDAVREKFNQVSEENKSDWKL